MKCLPYLFHIKFQSRHRDLKSEDETIWACVTDKQDKKLTDLNFDVDSSSKDDRRLNSNDIFHYLETDKEFKGSNVKTAYTRANVAPCGEGKTLHEYYVDAQDDDDDDDNSKDRE